MVAHAKELGQFFTPEMLVKFMIGHITFSKSCKILEPSCGDGVFIKKLREAGYDNIIGLEIDTDLVGVDLSIRNESFITAKLPDNFDLVIGNPPFVRWRYLPPK